jgi:hypothetical protein
MEWLIQVFRDAEKAGAALGGRRRKVTYCAF